jgi:hypothetical protein
LTSSLEYLWFFSLHLLLLSRPTMPCFILFILARCLYCRNPSLGLTTKARACKRSPGITFHAPESAKECEGLNPHTPKETPTLGVGVPVDSRIFRKQLQGSKLIGLRRSLYHWKALGTQMFEMGSHDPFGCLKHKLWSKEGS